MSDIFQEIEEDLRRDRFSSLWAKYQNLIYVGVAAIILGTAGTTVWRIYESRSQEQAGASYLAALQATGQDPKAAVGVFAGIAEAGGPVAGLARFDMARAALLSEDKQGAFDMLAAMAGDAQVDRPMQGAAAIMAGHLALDLGKPDQAEGVVKNLLTEGNPYRLMAMEITGLAADAAGDKVRALQVFKDIEPLAATPEAPAQLRERVAIMLDRLAQ